MVTDTTVTPEKKLTGAALAKPDDIVVAPALSPEQEAIAAFNEGRDPNDPEVLKTRVEALETAQVGLEQDLARAVTRAEKAEKALTRAKAKVVQDPTPGKPRALGPVDPLTGEVLRDAIKTGERIEVAFSDGKREIAGVAPLVVSGEAWRDHPLGLMLRDPVTISGPAGAGSVAVDGYALLIDGRQVAYTKRSDALTLAADRKVTLADDIYF